jgi:SAM-dependent methyltransferase
LHITDIRDYFIPSTAHFLQRLGLGHRLGAGLHLEVQDARALAYGDSTFDHVYSVSVLEHIPDAGDSAAIREIGRVLRPGGTVVLTVPYADAGYREEFVLGAVYERQGTSEPTFYQRRYDLAALQARLVQPSGLHLAGSTFFGEPGLRFEPYWNRIPMGWKAPVLWTQPLVAKALLRRLDVSQRHAACGVALKLVKPAIGT